VTAPLTAERRPENATVVAVVDREIRRVDVEPKVLIVAEIAVATVERIEVVENVAVDAEVLRLITF